MREMDILQKEDLPYFEELEKEGKAVILRFDSLEDLENFDLDALLKDDGKEPTLEEIQGWITSQQEQLKKKHQQVRETEERIVDQEKKLELLKRLQACRLADVDKELIMRAIELDIPDEKIIELLAPELSHDERQKIVKTYSAR